MGDEFDGSGEMNDLSEMVQPLHNLPFVWELKYEGTRSLVVGTIHLTKYDYTEDIIKKTDGIENLLVELDFSKLPQKFLQEISSITIGDELSKFSAEEQKKFAEILNVPLEKLKTSPMTMLDVYMIKLSEPKVITSVDMSLMMQAELKKINVQSLETLDEQREYGHGRKGLLTGKIRRMLELEKAQPGFVKEWYPKIFDFYDAGAAGELLTYLEIIQDKPNMEYMIEASKIRNEKMAKRSLEYLKKPSVIAVGAYHLLKEPDSVISFWQKKGIETKRVQ